MFFFSFYQLGSLLAGCTNPNLPPFFTMYILEIYCDSILPLVQVGIFFYSNKTTDCSKGRIKLKDINYYLHIPKIPLLQSVVL